MELDQLDLNPRVLAAVKRGCQWSPEFPAPWSPPCSLLFTRLAWPAGPVTPVIAASLKSVKEVLCISGPDLRRRTGLSSPDVQHLLTAAATHLRGHCVLTALQLYQQRERFPTQHQRLSLGCPQLDRLLGGGLPLDGITELAGCSSAGKTQLALQLCLTVQFPRQHGGLEAGAIYICTEDVFPSKRLRQLIAQQPRLRTDVPGEVVQSIRFGDRIFIEHVADVDALMECVSRRAALLLSRGLARLLVVDSVAAPFRCEFGSQASAARAQCLQSLGAALRRLSSTFQSPVLCVNQVTEAVEQPGPQDKHLCPALGITWANQLLIRLMADRTREEEAALGPGSRPARTLRVVFAPHLPLCSCSYTVSEEGVRGTPGTMASDTGQLQNSLAQVPRSLILTEQELGRRDPGIKVAEVSHENTSSSGGSR
ncbi:PREDICTED: DNA repair protein XRCC3 isoform X3 [Chinchilla lanigera]|nr:PREDICTED: DNA repair protein XRCC3 isoform X3 [Chinchilla lanigera]XP_013363300.1 PREDICTED: DNA repair protein XRCC3 isoform X3 [Chinchilla lanigera]XP_013363301.1 PREDICTED: DNA repair protein XRCC3 isoform X3 [Chinchilla lanigera]XP_013363302.1 PREDICTED: DNA repair protein XRCC3 isoform X3 [Chinchilla lanigera]XP_013363303.1 PREDICTED: DNA repair protein XRCC3 isoform X3 [Chinchilla lanigera]XP_013363304.1 PREDICTED: DNA repair protein XRCC3 isoform X3 [Chinchilla lanigera]